MILKRYGTTYQSVETNFNPTAMTEIGFRRDRAFSLPVDELERTYEEVSRSDLTAEASGTVQAEVERQVLDSLEEGLSDAVNALAEGEVLVILNDRDDHPKTRERRETLVVDGENRFHFHWWVDPPLKVAIFRPS